MWKDSYKLGIETIDAQHKKLFDMASALIRELEGEQRPDVYKQILVFLQEYVIFHFQDEEGFLESVNYGNLEEHKKQHRALTEQVEKYSHQLKESNYDPHMVKKMAGMLSAWLIYHVVHEDLKYTGKSKAVLSQTDSSYINYFSNSTIQVLESMVGLDPAKVTQTKIYDSLSQGDVFIAIELVGELTGSVIYGFTSEFAKRLVEAMMSFAPEELDELLCSALAEVANIATGNGTIAISAHGTACDICPPEVLQQALGMFLPYDEVRIDTAIGSMTVAISHSKA